MLIMNKFTLRMTYMSYIVTLYIRHKNFLEYTDNLIIDLKCKPIDCIDTFNVSMICLLSDMKLLQINAIYQYTLC